MLLMHFVGKNSHCSSYGRAVSWSSDSGLKCRCVHTDNICSYQIFCIICVNHQVKFYLFIIFSSCILFSLRPLSSDFTLVVFKKLVVICSKILSFFSNSCTALFVRNLKKSCDFSGSKLVPEQTSVWLRHLLEYPTCHRLSKSHWTSHARGISTTVAALCSG